MRSQHNIDLVRPLPIHLGDLDVSFRVFNPDLVDHSLVFDPTLFGIDPYWQPSCVNNPFHLMPPFHGGTLPMATPWPSRLPELGPA